MKAHFARGLVGLLLIALAACTSPPSGTATPSRVDSTMASPLSVDPTEPAAPPASPEPTQPGVPLPVARFAAINEDPVSDELAARFEAAMALYDVAGGGGMSATVMTAEGTWSGTIGKADDVRDLHVDDQFAVASITKSVVAAQVMLMVEAGELALDDLVADHLPEDVAIDLGGMTVRQLLAHRSGLPDYYEVGPLEHIDSDAQRVWTANELLALVPTARTTPGSTFAYAETNYLVLKLVIEHLRGRPLADVLRNGALAIDGLERLVHQPDEAPTEPMAMPAGGSHDLADTIGGYLPSLATATAYNASGAIASDAVSLARWWRALCAGEIVSQASLTEMSTLAYGRYGLGLFNPAGWYATAFGHTGQLPGYVSWAGCLPEEQAVIVVLTNHEVDDGHLEFSQGLARPLVDVLRVR